MFEFVIRISSFNNPGSNRFLVMVEQVVCQIFLRHLILDNWTLLLKVKQFEYLGDISWLHWSDVAIYHYFFLLDNFVFMNKIFNIFIIILICEACIQQLFRVNELMESIWTNVSSWNIMKGLKASCLVAKMNTPP